MKSRLCLFLNVILLFTVAASAHEEPNKTLWEKEQSKRVRARILAAGVAVETQWRQDSKDGQLSTKARTIRQEYDARGQLVLISAFSGDSISASAVYSYNPAGDMVSDVDLSADGGITEASVFLYDAEGRVRAGFAFDSTGRLTGRFTHRFDKARREIEFIKCGRQDTIEYTIDFRFPGDYDTSDYTTAVKKSCGGDTLLFVEKVLDIQGRTVQKKVTDRAAKKSYTFLYAYDQRGVLTELTKLTRDATVETRSHYTSNLDGTYREVRTTDGTGQLLRVTSFDYDYVSTINPRSSRQ